MSNAGVNAELVIRIKDATPQGAAAVVKSAEALAQKTTTAIERAAKKSADDVERSNKQQRTSSEKLSQAREALGVRSEKTIQKEIENTRRAYGQLASAGFASAQEQERAYAAVQSRITRLTNEMGRLTTAQRKAADEAKRLADIEARAAADQARGQKVVRGVVAGAVGVGAAAYTLKAPATAAMSFDRRLANMANTAYSERDAGGRIVGMKSLEDAVNKARRYGGGTRDQAAEALDTMIASGAVSEADAIAMLPGIMKAATASNTDANALATIGIRAKQNFKIDAADLPGLLSSALAAGQAGGFELKDMAKWLPQQMAMAGNLGLSGREGFAKLAAWNQGSVITAGTKDEAGNNLRDLLNELNTPHFKKFLGDELLGNGTPGKRGERAKHAKDVDALFLDYQSRGVDKVSATIELMQKIFSKDKNYQSLQGKLKNIDPKDESGRRAILEAMSAQVEGSKIGKVFHNQQSLMAMLGLMNNGDYVGGVLDKVRAEYGKKDDESAVGVGSRVIGGTASYKLEQANEDKLTGQKAAMDSLTPAIGKVAEAFSDLASKHPLLVGAGTLATGALVALAGSAGLAALAMGGNVPGGGAIGRAAGAIAGSPISKYALRMGKVGGLGAVGAMAGDWALGKAFGEESAITRYGSSMLTGAAAGATLGSIVPVLGTGIGALVGGGLGAAWEGIKDLLKPAEQKPLDVNAKLQVGLAPGLVLQSQSMNATGGNVYMNTGNVMNGAP